MDLKTGPQLYKYWYIIPANNAKLSRPCNILENTDRYIHPSERRVSADNLIKFDQMIFLILISGNWTKMSTRNMEKLYISRYKRNVNCNCQNITGSINTSSLTKCCRILFTYSKHAVTCDVGGTRWDVDQHRVVGIQRQLVSNHRHSLTISHCSQSIKEQGGIRLINTNSDSQWNQYNIHLANENGWPAH